MLSSKDVNTFEKFALSKNSFNTFTLCATIVATFVGAGTVIGSAEKVYASGVIYMMSISGMSLHFILSGIFFAPKLAEMKNILTIGDLIRKHWGDKAKILSGLLWLCSCIGIIAVQIAALGKVFGLFLPFNYVVNTILSASIIITYCSYGGIVAVVTTDVIQFVILCIALPLIFFVGLFHVGGWDVLTQSLPPGHLDLLSRMSILQFGMLFLTLALGEALTPPSLQRALIAQNPRQARISMIGAGIIILPLIFFAGSLGLLTHVLNNSIYPEQTLFSFVNHMPLFLKSVTISAFIAVIMSSADSFLNSGAISFVNDIVKPLSKKPLRDYASLRIAKLSTVALGVLATYFAISVKDILDALIYSYRFWAPSMVVPIAALILNKPISTFGFYASCAAGLIVLGIWDIFNLIDITTVDGIMPGLFTNLLVYIFFYYKNKKLRMLRVLKAYFDYQ